MAKAKRSIDTPKVGGRGATAVNDALGQYLEENPSDARCIVEKCLTAFRAREAARKARALVQRKGALDGFSLPGKLADYSERDLDESVLLIVEGMMAHCRVKCCRDRLHHAILAI